MHDDRIPAADGLSLAQRLRVETREEHTRAERSAWVARLIAGRLDVAGYCLMLRNLHALYEALEALLCDCRDAPGIAAFLEPALARRASLAADLRTLHGADWQNELPVAKALSAYTAHLSDLARQRPVMLVGHAYVRYFGDLNGGQVVRNVVARAYRLDADGGLAFYAFDDKDALLTRLKDGLALFPATGPEALGIVAEAKAGYAMHIRLFEELEVLAAARAPTSSARRIS